MASANSTSDLYANENWEEVPGWEGFYSVSDYGRAWSLPRILHKKDGSSQPFQGGEMKPRIDWQGRRYIDLQKLGFIRRVSIHALILETFVGPRPEGMDVCHNNGDPSDNRLVNLRYGTRSENMLDKRKHGTDTQLNKTHCPYGHVLAMPNLVVSTWEKHNRRACLACSRARAYVSYHTDQKSNFNRIVDSYYEVIMRYVETPAA